MLAVVLVNVGFSVNPAIDWFWSLLVGGALVSYRLGAPAVALASAVAFLISETVDWLVFSLTHRPFAARVWRSLLASAPIDTAVFLHLADLWSWPLFLIGVGSKLLAGGLISISLRQVTNH